MTPRRLTVHLKRSWEGKQERRGRGGLFRIGMLSIRAGETPCSHCPAVGAGKGQHQPFRLMLWDGKSESRQAQRRGAFLERALLSIGVQLQFIDGRAPQGPLEGLPV